MVAYLDSDKRIIEVEEGVIPAYRWTAAVECKCNKVARYRNFRRLIPPEFKKANLARLKPILSKHPGQAEIIGYVKGNPSESYIFCGRNRVGKSHIGWCLARKSLLSGYRVVACNLAVLLDEYRAMEKPVELDQPPSRPRILSPDLEILNARYCLFLQEFDKPRPTLYAAEKLFELIDAAFNYQHQILITSNLSVPELSTHWSQHGARYGMGIVSRIQERCTEANLF